MISMYIKSLEQAAYSLKDSYEWGKFVIYIEFGDDNFATRSVQVYKNGYITRYDREHWEDQFGSLPDFRFGKTWIEHWGNPNEISQNQFEQKWQSAEFSIPFKQRNRSPEEPCLWIQAFKSGEWDGQS